MSTDRARSWRTLRILVVDDYPHAAEILGRLLKRLGHELQTAIDGRQALESAERFHPEVIVSDIAMPKLDAYELAKKIREQPWGKHIVLIALERVWCPKRTPSRAEKLVSTNTWSSRPFRKNSGRSSILT